MPTLSITHILAIRHGETNWNVDGRIQGAIDIPLNKTGEEQVRRLALALTDSTSQTQTTRLPMPTSIDAIYSSALLRAMQTANAIAETTGLTVQIHHGLREREFGVFEGKTSEEINEEWPEMAQRWQNRVPDFCPPDGESLETFQKRVLAAANDLVRLYPGKHIAIVAHGGVMDVLYRHAQQLSIPVYRTWGLNNAVINRLICTQMTTDDEVKWEVLVWEDRRHLEGMLATETHS